MSDCYMQIVHAMKTDETPTSRAPTPLTPTLTHEIIQGIILPTTRKTSCCRRARSRRVYFKGLQMIFLPTMYTLLDRDHNSTNLTTD
ncbi:hypothetical protein DPMN_162848 [Dreissena polymorpha]|uniref:Uncharacterized protein n=1 Tax=Dreissena polymorpha TaxID=45954 RepID=A0A9D4IU15_DREPO|nr:hypothetical protein DPMN_162848 [Dreissena polymorpha]